MSYRRLAVPVNLSCTCICLTEHHCPRPLLAHRCSLCSVMADTFSMPARRFSGQKCLATAWTWLKAARAHSCPQPVCHLLVLTRQARAAHSQAIALPILPKLTSAARCQAHPLLRRRNLHYIHILVAACFRLVPPLLMWRAHNTDLPLHACHWAGLDCNHHWLGQAGRPELMWRPAAFWGCLSRGRAHAAGRVHSQNARHRVGWQSGCAGLRHS